MANVILLYVLSFYGSFLMFLLQVYSGIHGRTLVFTQTKRDADELAVSPCLSQDARVLHGDIVQKQREATLKVSVIIVHS